MNFTSIFIRRPVLASVISLLILLLGLQGLSTLPVRQFPKTEETVISVTTSYPGANADLMQGFITTPIAQAVASTEGLDYVTSSSVQGLSTVSVHMKLNANPDAALTEVLTKVQQVRNDLPTESKDPVVVKGTGNDVAIQYLSFNSDRMSPEEVTEYITRVVQPQLATTEGVAEAKILGAKSFAMRVWVDPLRLAARQVTAADVVTAIRSNNFLSAPGRTEGELVTFAIRTDTTLRTAEAFGDLVVRSSGDNIIRLKDVAKVELGSESYDARVTFDGKEAIFVAINPTPAANPLVTAENVRGTMETILRQMPEGMSGQIVYDATKFIEESIYEVGKTIPEAVAIVVVVILLFLGSFRAVIIPVVTIPLSLIGVLFCLYALGYSINTLTLLAMVLAIGLVVDDAIVVVENIHRHIEEGLTPRQAALQGAGEIAGPVVSMTITLAAVYAPIGFATGLTGALFREFAFTLAGAVIISGIVALTLSPMMTSKLLKPHGQGAGWFQRTVDRFFTGLQGWYQRRLHHSLNYRPVTVFMSVVLLGATAFLFVKTPSELAPKEDQGFMFMIMNGPRYANLEYMNRFSDKLIQDLNGIADKDKIFLVSGFDGLSSAFGGMVFKPWSERTTSAAVQEASVQAALSGIAGLEGFAATPPALPGSGGGPPIQFVIKAPGSPEQVYALAEEVANEARKSGMFIFASATLSFDRPELSVEIDRNKAAALGIAMSDIGTTLNVMLGGNDIARFDRDNRSYKVIPQVAQADRLNPEELDKYFVRSSGGDLVPLSSLVKLTTQATANSFSQFNQLNSSTIQAVPIPNVVTLGQSLDFLKSTADRILPRGVSYDYEGDSRQYITEGNTIMIAFIFAVIVIFLVLAAQFESFRDPLIVMMSVPLSIFGALATLNVGSMLPMIGQIIGTVIDVPGASLNIYTQIGLITLVGLITKHGILMVEFANKLQEEQGLSRRDAIEQAAAIRLRPILMTTAAMVLGVVPLLYASGAGAAARFSIGLVIASGMSIGTLFTLFVVPMVYTFLARDHHRVAEEDEPTAHPKPAE
ncbi:efflux RND transporter permease subunit [Inquilinus sp.]|jgi:hydrophobe/amphiphile efflux-1 (HAE1) family protein|uniref:efflux RND transporter permease subunit n=1 Tax=Inquilinus sp. TaxID=1932117 RepID=UPI00378338A0